MDMKEIKEGSTTKKYWLLAYSVTPNEGHPISVWSIDSKSNVKLNILPDGTLYSENGIGLVRYKYSEVHEPHYSRGVNLLDAPYTITSSYYGLERAYNYLKLTPVDGK